MSYKERGNEAGILRKEWKNEAGYLHREDGPALAWEEHLLMIDGFFGPDDKFYTAIDLATAKMVSFHGIDQSFLTVNCELIVEVFAS